MRPGRNEAGDLYLFDCGYWLIDTYHEITEGGDFFPSNAPRQHQARDGLRTARSRQAVDPEANEAGYRVLFDQYVRPGNDRTGRDGGDPDRWYRLLTVEVSTEEEIQILTNLL